MLHETKRVANDALVVEYAQKYIALVGIMPIRRGCNPLNNPIGPSVLKMLFNTEAGVGVTDPNRFFIVLDCNCVLTT